MRFPSRRATALPPHGAVASRSLATSGRIAPGSGAKSLVTSMKNKLTTQIEKALNAEIVTERGLPVGFGLIGLRIVLSDGREAAVKASRGGDSSRLELEAYMLRELKRQSDLPVPEIYYSDDTLLIMEWLQSGSAINSQVQRHAAELLAALHRRPFARFGYERDTQIGPLPQPNPLSEKWVPFFRDQRLLYMANEAVREGSLPKSLHKRLTKLAARLDTFLAEPTHPSLLHGDMWRGNIIARDNRISGFIDPALYCGHPEIELAFLLMFNTAGSAFFDAYQALAPIEPGFFETRADIYNLYPGLVHVRLFGDGYLPTIDQTLKKLGL